MDVITQTKHYFSSFQTANLVEGITGLSSHYIIPSSSCKVHRRASNGHCFFSTSNNVPSMVSKLWCRDSNWLPRGSCSQMPAWQESYALMCSASSSLLFLSVKKKMSSEYKNEVKCNQEFFRWFIPPASILTEKFPSGAKRDQKLFVFLSFTFLEHLCWAMCDWTCMQPSQPGKKECVNFWHRSEMLIDIKCYNTKEKKLFGWHIWSFMNDFSLAMLAWPLAIFSWTVTIAYSCIHLFLFRNCLLSDGGSSPISPGSVFLHAINIHTFPLFPNIFLLSIYFSSSAF